MPRTRTHPGEVLTEEFMKPHRVDTVALALALDVSETEIAAVAGARKPVTATLAARLARCVSASPEFWVNLQSAYDASVAGE